MNSRLINRQREERGCPGADKGEAGHEIETECRVRTAARGSLEHGFLTERE